MNGRVSSLESKIDRLMDIITKGDNCKHITEMVGEK
jgi:hypothetical protein